MIFGGVVSSGVFSTFLGSLQNPRFVRLYREDIIISDMCFVWSSNMSMVSFICPLSSIELLSSQRWATSHTWSVLAPDLAGILCEDWSIFRTKSMAFFVVSDYTQGS